jgi:hypothetical protein
VRAAEAANPARNELETPGEKTINQSKKAMAEQVINHALTNRARIKDKLSIDNQNHDTVLDRLITAATDWIESQTNRRFKKTTYTNETYNVDQNRNFLILKQTPVITLSSFQYREGLPNAITWHNVNAAEYELHADPETGIIYCYFTLQRGPNQYRATYDAGYLIDFDNINDTSKHTLPGDLTELTEKMVIKAFKKREKAGLQSESFDGNQTAWQKELDAEDEATLNRYKKINLI